MSIGTSMRDAEIVARYTSSRDRAEHFRRRAKQLRDIAEIQADAHFRQRLIGLARQYQDLADNLDTPQAVVD